ncbi:MAG: ectonucleotide pyrophosphatase/phosphodiesterase [Melioribacteraceae bacterium]|nr:ectonucleotide pyrophosphatase/phosphodiesterase [Melioribacteraceae bacterium]
MKIKKLYFALVFIFISFLNLHSKPYIIIVSFDGFRWDYLNRNITPNLNEILNDGVHALSLRPSFPSKTFPNHISILTGMYPDNHGIISNNIKNIFNGKRYRIGNNKSVTEPEWYQGEFFWETAERNGIKTASYFWPGSEISDTLRSPNKVKPYEHNFPFINRIDTVVSWLKLPIQERPQFITLYFHETDSQGHDFGTESDEINEAIALVDSLAGYLFKQIQELPIKDSVNILFVSDHGMQNIDKNKIVNVEEFISQYKYDLVDSGPLMQIFPNSENDKENIYAELKRNEKHFKAYLKNELPDYYHFGKHPLIAPIVLIADYKAYLVNNRISKRNYDLSAATHGYAKDHINMHGIFIANGPAFNKGMKTGTIWNIDIYPLLCELFKITPRSNIDGKIERIRFILNNE